MEDYDESCPEYEADHKENAACSTIQGKAPLQIASHQLRLHFLTIESSHSLLLNSDSVSKWSHYDRSGLAWS